MPNSNALRIEANIPEVVGECWIWTGCLAANGYGRLSFNGKSLLAHRVSYEEHVGPIPDGLVIDHLCRNRACVNPDHLEPVTNRENILRGVSPAAQQARQTHCVHGHEFTPENTRYQNKTGKRQCRICRRAAENARRRASSAGPSGTSSRQTPRLVALGDRAASDQPVRG